MIGTTINGYTISKVIGTGGMATVYYAQNSIGKPFALKVLKDQYSNDEHIQQRFIQESDIMISLDNISGIRKVIDRIQTEDGKLIMVMEYLEGLDLGEYLKQKGHVNDMTFAKDIAKQVLTTLGEAHKRGIIHRDIKPSNLFLTEDGYVKILDFGISKILFGADTDATEKQTATNKYMGTLSFMSPEQVKLLPDIDQRTDIYSFGLTLFNLITGDNPADLDEYSLAGIEDKQLHRAIKNATVKNRDKRAQTCEQFLADIFCQEQSPSKVINDQKPISASIPTKRGKLNVGFIIGAFVLFVILIIAFIIANNDSKYNKDTAPNYSTDTVAIQAVVDTVVTTGVSFPKQTRISSLSEKEDINDLQTKYDDYLEDLSSISLKFTTVSEISAWVKGKGSNYDKQQERKLSKKVANYELVIDAIKKKDIDALKVCEDFCTDEQRKAIRGCYYCYYDDDGNEVKFSDFGFIADVIIGREEFEDTKFKSFIELKYFAQKMKNILQKKSRR